MLGKRSRPTTSKQALMADYRTLQSSTENYRKPASSFFGSPGLFTGFASKGFSDSESLTSPTSILDGKPFSALRNPFRSNSNAPETTKPENKVNWEKLDSRGVSLGLLDVLIDKKSDSKLSKSDTPTVLFGSQLKIQIPSLPPSVNSPVDSPKSPADFGIKTRNCKLVSLSPGFLPSSSKKSPFVSSNSGLENTNLPRVFSGLSITEMELSEDYTCVITHGPNPKTTHIFEDCIVESCHGAVGLPSSWKENQRFINRLVSYHSENFLSFCYNCKRSLGQGKDIYMYRGDKAFCSSDCRYKQMALEGAKEITEVDDVFDTSS